MHVALISSAGFIEDFTIEGLKNDSFPKLSKTEFNKDICYFQVSYYHEVQFQWLGFFYKDSLNYVPCNPKLYVIKHLVDEGKNSHHEIPNSRIPNLHLGGEIFGIHVGYYFWVIGGTVTCTEFPGVNNHVDFFGKDMIKVLVINACSNQLCYRISRQNITLEYKKGSLDSRAFATINIL